ncbi:MAG: serine hydrolase domain-containing protein [Henriciella sp.]
MSMFRTMLGAAAIAASLTLSAFAAPVDTEQLDRRLNKLVQRGNMVGLAVAVIEDGEITFAQGYGETHRGGAAVSTDTVFRWASLSKGVASTMTVKLVSDGKLSLSDTLSKFATSIRLPKMAERKGTVDNLLSHMVGIVPNAYDLRLEGGADPIAIRRSLAKLKAMCPVGECHTYQNVAFDAVSEIVQDVEGKPFTEAVEEYLFQPLQMFSASYGRDALQGSFSWARPHRKRRADILPVLKSVKVPYYKVPAAGGANGSILDLAKFAKAQMGLNPEVLDQDDLDELHTPRVYTRREQSGMSRRYGGQVRDARYALGWRVYKYGKAGHRVVGHRGAVEGYRSLILFDPERDTGVVALWNSNAREPVGVQFEVMDMVYGLPAQDWMKIDQPKE